MRIGKPPEGFELRTHISGFHWSGWVENKVGGANARGGHCNLVTDGRGASQVRRAEAQYILEALLMRQVWGVRKRQMSEVTL